MNQRYVNEVASWHYDGVYSFYDTVVDEDLRVLMDAKKWRDVVRAVLNENDEPVACASFYVENDESWLSLALRPDLTCRGLGEEFVARCVNHATSQYRSNKLTIRLHVALVKPRVTKVCQRAGFVETQRTVSHTHDGHAVLIEMQKHVAHELFQIPVSPIVVSPMAISVS
jgi:ribosomal-protein-alanine N-acetyltransferase